MLRLFNRPAVHPENYSNNFRFVVFFFFFFFWYSLISLESLIGPSPIITTVAAWHDDVIKWKHFPLYWPVVRGNHRSLMNSPHKGQWRGALMFSLFCVWINSWVNNRDAGDLRGYRAHYDVIVMATWALVSVHHGNPRRIVGIIKTKHTRLPIRYSKGWIMYRSISDLLMPR